MGDVKNQRSYSLRPGEKGEWISALEAVHLLSSHLGGDKKAKRALIERLNDGAIESTAWWVATGYDVGLPFLARGVNLPEDYRSLSRAELHDLTVEQSQPEISQEKVGTNIALTVNSGSIVIGGAFWKLASKEDRAQWDWSSGLFKCSYPSPAAIAGAPPEPTANPNHPRVRMYALGVHFDRPQVLEILNSATAFSDEKIKTSSRAGRKRSEDWPRWIAETIWLYHEEGFGTLTANQLVEKVQDRAARRGVNVPGRSVTHPAAVEVIAILNELRAREE